VAAGLVCVGNYFKDVFPNLSTNAQAVAMVVGCLMFCKLVDVASGNPSKSITVFKLV
jgi:hypothetical protein